MTIPNIVWEQYSSSFRVQLRGHVDIVYKLGDTVQYDKRTDGVVITSIKGGKEGPTGFTYLPWRDSEKRWATPHLTLRGDPRFIVCYPAGNKTYGQHIEWTTLKTIEHPDREEIGYAKFVDELRNKLFVDPVEDFT